MWLWLWQWPGRCSSDSTPSLGTSIGGGCGPKKTHTKTRNKTQVPASPCSDLRRASRLPSATWLHSLLWPHPILLLWFCLLSHAEQLPVPQLHPTLSKQWALAQGVPSTWNALAPKPSYTHASRPSPSPRLHCKAIFLCATTHPWLRYYCCCHRVL